MRAHRVRNMPLLASGRKFSGLSSSNASCSPPGSFTSCYSERASASSSMPLPAAAAAAAAAALGAASAVALGAAAAADRTPPAAGSPTAPQASGLSAGAGRRRVAGRLGSAASAPAPQPCLTCLGASTSARTLFAAGTALELAAGWLVLEFEAAARLRRPPRPRPEAGAAVVHSRGSSLGGDGGAGRSVAAALDPAAPRGLERTDSPRHE